MTMFMVNVEQRHVTDDLRTKPTDLGRQSTCRLLVSTLTISIYGGRTLDQEWADLMAIYKAHALLSSHCKAQNALTCYLQQQIF